MNKILVVSGIVLAVVLLAAWGIYYSVHHSNESGGTSNAPASPLVYHERIGLVNAVEPLVANTPDELVTDQIIDATDKFSKEHSELHITHVDPFGVSDNTGAILLTYDPAPSCGCNQP